MFAELVAYARDHLEGPQTRPYYAERAVRWQLRIGADGVPVSCTPSSLVSADHPYGRPLAVPSITRTAGTAPAIAVDTIEYVLGRDADEPEKETDSERARIRLQAFIDLNREWSEAGDEGPAAAIAAFYEGGHHRRIEFPEPTIDPKSGVAQSSWRSSDLLAFYVRGSGLACDSESAQRFWARAAVGRKSLGIEGLCLVCGEHGELLKTLPQQLPKRLVPGATQSPALSSVNKSAHGFRLATDLRHTPICTTCGLRAPTALQHLLGDPDHSERLGNAKLVWWCRGDDLPVASLKRPNEHVDDIAALIAAARLGDAPAVREAGSAVDRFFSASISGNVARVMVRDWVDLPLGQVRANLGRWFDHIRSRPDEHLPPGVGLLALACGKRTKDGKTSKYADFKDGGADRPDGVYEVLYRTALFAEPLPPTLAAHLVKRVSRDRHMDRYRAALLRHWLNKAHLADPPEERIPMALDPERGEPAYLAGRLFCIYESMQHAANAKAFGGRRRDPGSEAGAGTAPAGSAEPGLNSTFFDRYFSGAIKNPALGWAAGAEMSAAWLKRIRGRNETLAGWYAKEIDGIVSRLDAMPTAAGIEDKILFLMGYHHQREDGRRRAAERRARNGDTDPDPENNSASENASGPENATDAYPGTDPSTDPENEE